MVDYFCDKRILYIEFVCMLVCLELKPYAMHSEFKITGPLQNLKQFPFYLCLYHQIDTNDIEYGAQCKRVRNNVKIVCPVLGKKLNLAVKMTSPHMCLFLLENKI